MCRCSGAIVTAIIYLKVRLLVWPAVRQSLYGLYPEGVGVVGVGLEKVVAHAGVPFRAKGRCPPGSPGTWLGVGVAILEQVIRRCTASPPPSQAWSRGEAVDMRCLLCDVCGFLVWGVSGRGFWWSPELYEGRCSMLFRLLCVVKTVSFCLGYRHVFVSCFVVAWSGLAA